MSDPKLPWNVHNDWLQGITILDLSSLLPCPFAAQLLSRMGARVIKIESPLRPDPARQFGYVPTDGGPSSVYREVNRRKELVMLDLKSQTDRAKLYDLVKTSHGAIEGYRPDVRERLGIDYKTLASQNPSFVLCSVGGYHSAGPLRSRAGHDANFVARSGILDLTRDSAGNAVMLGIPIADITVAYAAALRFVSALFQARTSGKGTHIELSIEEALIEIQLPFLREAYDSGETPKAGGTLITGQYACYCIYTLDGGSFALGALEEKFWATFCHAIARPELIELQFEVGAAADRVKTEVSKALSVRSFAQWHTIFESTDCCIEPVLSTKDVLNGLQSP